jgi:hypothetical protein
MTKIGVISKEEFIARTIAIAKGEYKPAEDDPKMWFESKTVLVNMVFKLFGLWGLEPTDQLTLMGLDPAQTGLLDRLRSGEANMQETGDTLERVGWLLSIHRELRTIFPRNRDLVYQWATAKNQRYGGKTPLEIMKQEGLMGIKRIAIYLEQI